VAGGFRPLDPDGRIDRDPKTGVAIGSLQEGAADLVSAVVPAPTAEDEEAGLRYAIKLLNGYGITAIQDAAVYERDLKAYRALDTRGALTLRVVAVRSHPGLAAPLRRRSHGNGRGTPPRRVGSPHPSGAAFTINAAYTNRLDKTTGSLEPGKSADLIVLDRNLFDIAPTQIAQTRVLVTLFEGRAVHGDLGTL
jgi:predicted amidohydrolase YtcJ